MIRVRGYDLIATDFAPAEREEWMADAACLDIEPEVFFDKPNHKTAPAREMCHGNINTGRPVCPVQQQCLVWTLLTEPPNEQRFGFFGGHGPAARKKIYKALKEKQVV